MKRILYILIAVTIIFTSAHAKETNSAQHKACVGSWILQNYGGWVVRNNNGVILPISTETIFFDCQRRQFFPTKELNGFEVEIECHNTDSDTQLPSVEKIFFICR